MPQAIIECDRRGARRRARPQAPRSLAFGVVSPLAGGFALAQGKPDTAGLKVAGDRGHRAPDRVLREGRRRAARARFGKLEWRGGLVLTSPSSSFGGWSGLALDPDGSRLLAISDAGTWMTAEMVTRAPRPARGLTQASIGPLKARGGKPLVRERDRDSEALALADGTLANGTVLIAFEKNNRIGRFAIADGEVGAAARLPQDAARAAAHARTTASRP